MATPKVSAAPRTNAAMFIDFENIYYHIKNFYLVTEDAHDYAVNLVLNLRAKLSKDLNLETLAMEAYADFDALPTGPQGPLYLMGVSTHNVLGTSHKNAADMQLCIDAMEVLYTRADINTIVLVAGDRDYIPLLQRFRKHGKQIKVVSFRGSVSGDLLQMLGEEHFIDANDVLGKDKVKELDEIKKKKMLANTKTTATKPAVIPIANAIAGVSHIAPPPPVRSLLDQIISPEEIPAFATPKRVTGQLEQQCLAFVLTQLSKFRVNELWAGPFYKQLAEEIPQIADRERRDLVNALINAGAIRIEKRDGKPNPYSVIVANYDHVDVRASVPAQV